MSDLTFCLTGFFCSCLNVCCVIVWNVWSASNSVRGCDVNLANKSKQSLQKKSNRSWPLTKWSVWLAVYWWSDKHKKLSCNTFFFWHWDHFFISLCHYTYVQQIFQQINWMSKCMRAGLGCWTSLCQQENWVIITQFVKRIHYTCMHWEHVNVSD